MKEGYASKRTPITKNQGNEGKKPVKMIKDRIVKNAKVTPNKRKPGI